MNKIDIVIPTMWRAKQILEGLANYVNSNYVQNIFVIDNAFKQRPNNFILENSKITLVNYGRNIYVNPAWNEGYYRSKADVIAIINDDIVVDPKIFERIAKTDFSNIDLIGVHLQGTPDNYNITNHKDGEERLFKLNVNKNEPIGGQSYAFGICMFVKRSSYKVIPSLYQIWFGDDYLVQHCENIYCLKTSLIQGEISKTLVALDTNNEISQRIVLDAINVSTFGHFKNSKNWDLVRNTVDRKKMKFEPKPSDIFAEEFRRAKQKPSNINEHVSLLYELGKECRHITEMGVETGVSTRAWLNTNAELISYDIRLNDTVSKLFEIAKQKGKRAQYIQADTRNIEIEETDLLFIDTWHTYKQLSKELALHGNKAKKYLVFHDTHTFGLTGEDRLDPKGLLPAIIEFIITNPHWRFKILRTNNNGLTVLERIS